MEPLRLALVSSDPVTADGATAYLRTCRRLTLLSADQLGTAEVGLVLATEVTGRTLTLIEQLSRESGNPELPVVLVADSISRNHLARAIGHGLVSFLPRTETGLKEVVRAVFDSKAGRTELPQDMIRVLVEQVRAAQRHPSGPDSLTMAELTGREIDILALVAEGMSTAEIAVKLNYAERTIKNILHATMTRLNLRNRAHAVAYAIRADVI